MVTWLSPIRNGYFIHRNNNYVKIRVRIDLLGTEPKKKIYKQRHAYRYNNMYIVRII